MKPIVRIVRLSLFLLVLSMACPAYCQTVTLSEAQRVKLTNLIHTDKEAGALFKRLQREADESLVATPNPTPDIQSEGKLKNDPVRIRTRESLKDLPKISALSYAFAVTGDAHYGTKAKEFLLAWAQVNHPNGDPIDETNLEAIILAYELTRKQFSSAEAPLVETWLKRVAATEMASRKERNATGMNNWNSHRLKIVGLIGFTLADKTLIKYAVDGYKTQIEANLHPDGSSYDFHERDALHYHLYDLEPLLALCQAAQQNGIDLYHFQAASGASLDKSIRFLIPYCDGTKTHPEFVNSKVAFDKKRAQSGDKHYQAGRLFEPKEAASVFEQAAFFDAAYAAFYFKVSHQPATPYPTWAFLLHAAQKP